jgi:predicted RNA-binding Zn ribbon-like protein
VISAAAELVRDFVNTYEPQTGEERLRSFLPEDCGPDDLARAAAIREGLRAVLIDHTAPVDPDFSPVRLSFEGGTPHFVACEDSAFDRAMAAVADAIRQCSADGTWPRLKVCARDSCRWAYYDESRNHARRWCSMAGCGTHVKNKRAYSRRIGDQVHRGER